MQLDRRWELDFDFSKSHSAPCWRSAKQQQHSEAAQHGGAHSSQRAPDMQCICVCVHASTSHRVCVSSNLQQRGSLPLISPPAYSESHGVTVSSKISV